MYNYYDIKLIKNTKKLFIFKKNTKNFIYF